VTRFWGVTFFVAGLYFVVLLLIYFLGSRETEGPVTAESAGAASAGTRRRLAIHIAVLVVTIVGLALIHSALTSSTAILFDAPHGRAIPPLRLVPLDDAVLFDVHLTGSPVDGAFGETVKHWWTAAGVPHLRVIAPPESMIAPRGPRLAAAQDTMAWVIRGAFRDSLRRAVFLIPNEVAYHPRLMVTPSIYYYRNGSGFAATDSAHPYVSALEKFDAPTGHSHWPIQMRRVGRHGIATWNWREASPDTVQFSDGDEKHPWWSAWRHWISPGRWAAILSAFAALGLIWIAGRAARRVLRNASGRERYGEGVMTLLAATLAFSLGAILEGAESDRRARDHAPPRFDLVGGKILIEFPVVRGDGKWPREPRGPAMGMCSTKCGNITPRGAFISEERAIVAVDTALVLNDDTLAMEPQVFTVEHDRDTTFYYADKTLGHEFAAGTLRDGKWHVVLEPKANGRLYAHRWDGDLEACLPASDARH